MTAHKTALAGVDVPKGYFRVYVREQERSICDSDIIFESAFIPRFVSSSRGRILFDHPMGGLSIPCREEVFINLTSRLGRLQVKSMTSIFFLFTVKEYWEQNNVSQHKNSINRKTVNFKGKAAFVQILLVQFINFATYKILCKG